MKVSVLTPSLNYATFIGDAIASVAAQETIDVEHVVQDGGSHDSTAAVVAAFNGRVRFASEPDRGQSDALNRALARATGDWVGWLNADEFYLPRALPTLAAVAARGDVDVVYGDAVFVDEVGRVLRLLPQHSFSARVLRLYGTFLPTCTMLIRRELLEETPWDDGLRRIMDWDLCLTLLRSRARFKYVPMPIAAFRVHDARVTADPAAKFASEYELVRSRHGLPPTAPARSVGRVMHGTLKALEGAYGRQRAATRVRGRDLRWFRPEIGIGGAAALVDAAYGGTVS